MHVTQIAGTILEVGEYLAKQEAAGSNAWERAEKEAPADLTPMTKAPACIDRTGPCDTAALRLECLRLVVVHGDGTVDRARAYVDFVLGRSADLAATAASTRAEADVKLASRLQTGRSEQI